MTTTRWIILVVWLLYIVLLVRFCSDNYAASCCGPPEEISNPYSLAFQDNDATPITGESIDSLLAAINAGADGNNVLEITGYFYETEAAPGGSETMGFARAENIRQQFFPELPAERIRLRSRRRSGPPPGEPYFEAAGFDWKAAADTQDPPIEDLGDSMLVRFPYNSVEQIVDSSVENYLEKLAVRVQQTGERINLTGHTDNIGSDEYNDDLGIRRARAIRNLLVARGVPETQISLASRGETDPVDTNTTEDGRSNNRRVEIRLLKDE